MIISASRRTDIPAFYGPWFMNRLAQGFVDVRPPFAKHHKRVSLAAADVQAFVFWTRNFAPLLDHVAAIQAIAPFYVTYTLTNYPRSLENHTPNLAQSLVVIEKLVGKLGRGAVVWRYDPIILTDETPIAFHLANFENLARHLSPMVKRVVISLADATPRAVQGLARANIQTTDPASLAALACVQELADIAKSYGLEIQSCAEEIDLSPQGITPGRCIDFDLLNGLGLNLNPRKDPGQRKDCGCYPAIDIGAYNSCLHGCVYCYATGKHDTAKANFAAHDPQASSLINTKNPAV